MSFDVRGYLGRAAAFSGQNPQTGYHGLVFAYGKHLVRRTFLFIVPLYLSTSSMVIGSSFTT